MSEQDDLLEYYEDELTYLRRMGAEFARRYPKVAGRLELGADECADPHVERLLEGFAFLAARLQRNIDSELPEISQALLGNLYPHFVQPVPAMSVARFEVDAELGQLTSGYTIARLTPLFAQTREGLVCRFRTCYPVTLWPVALTYAGLESTSRYEFLDVAANVATVLRLRLECQGGTLQDIDLKSLRFFLNGDRLLVNAIYELLFGHVFRVALVPESTRRPVFLPPDSIRPVGFALDQDVLAYPRRSHPGYRLLQEYFSFPDKFHFFDLEHLAVHGSEKAFDILILLDQLPAERVTVKTENVLLGCTPVVNLFAKTSEPIRIDHRTVEYPLIPDMRRERTTEVHSILSVAASPNPHEEARTIAPFYSFTQQGQAERQSCFWHARRQWTGRPDLPGTELLLSFLDLDFRPQQPPHQTVFAHTLCTNRDLAEKLPAGALLQIEEAAPLVRVTCVRRPTPQLQPPLGGATLWRLVSHLSLNYLSLTEGSESLRSLREILRLYSHSSRASAYQQILGLRELSTRRVVRRVGSGPWGGVCRGTEVTLTFDESMYTGSNAFLLAAVLNHFLALYAAVDSFTELVIKSIQREGIWHRWPPMAGDQIVL